MNNYNEKINEFQKDLLRNKSENTVKAYVNKIELFLKWLNDKEITKDNFQEYIDSINNLAASTLNQYIVAINNFIKFIGKERIDIKSKNGAKSNIEMVKKDDYKELLKYTDTEKIDEQKLRYKCIIMLGGEGGLRASEVLNLKVEDIKDNLISVLNSKRNKSRKVPLSKKNLKMLNGYIKTYGKTDEIFSIKYITLNKKFNKYCDMLNIQDVTFHSLRHMAATTLLENGNSPKAVADFIGDSVKVLLEVYAHTTESQLSKMALTI